MSEATFEEITKLLKMAAERHILASQARDPRDAAELRTLAVGADAAAQELRAGLANGTAPPAGELNRGEGAAH